MTRNLSIAFVVILLAGGAYFFFTKGGYQAPSTQNQQAEKPTSSPVITNKITAKNFAFNPKEITVNRGDTVTWTNEDAGQHQIASKPDGALFKSDLLNQGQSYSFTFNTAGEFDYLCLIHPSMTGKVIVK